jgi:hypothetical protein
MADNIKIVGQVVNIERINRYTLQDEQLLLPIVQQETFGLPNDYVEYFLFDQGGNPLNSDYNYTSYRLPSNSAYSQSLLPNLEIDPIQDIQNLGYESGEVVARYNFFRKLSGEPFSNQLFIQQISTDRTELRIGSTELSDDELLSIAENFANKQLEVPYYYYVILNFGDNNQVIAVNIVSEIDVNGNVSILFKLYEPLPLNIVLKTTFWLVEEIVNPYIFNLNLDKLITPLPQPFLKGPNFDIDLDFKSVVPTQYSNLNQLVTSFTGSSYQATLNSLTNQEVNINVDYSILNEFIHYSSATERLHNFMYKVGEIQGYQYEINTFSPLTSSNASLTNQINIASSSLNTVIAGFDGFETYLYYNSSSLVSSIVEYTLETGSFLEYNIAPYPKFNDTQPYILYPSASITAQNWYESAANVALAFDNTNKDILINTIPSYITDDPGNYLPYITFVNMIGQYFDNIWVYIDRLTDVWDNNNNLDKGISQDLVYDWLSSFGMKLYSSQENQNILNYNVGGFSGSVDFNGDYSPTSSFLNNVPRKDLVLESYKRLYHNLPYLFKGKGAHGGLQGLITIFGITGSILPIKEYGGTTDYQDLLGYNPEKITIGSNTITGSILSSIKRLETSPTSSRNIRSQDLHFIDVSFSPQTQIDKAVSASITAVNPNWVIDDYIAYPQDLYGDTYPSLSFQRDYWFGQTFTHPTEGFDYGGFIRLIQFFDNSLFKMVQDFTPARGNTWTGVTLKSPVLERPKVPEARPLFTNYPNLEGYVTGAAIVPIYDPYYFYLEGDKEPYYNGNISGSFIDTYAIFEENNRNPYLVNNTVGYIPPGFVSGNTDFILNYDAPRFENFFLNSDFNALQNNIDISLTSQYRKKLTPIYSTDALGRVFTSYSITSSVELQDSYLTSTAYTNPRYDGVQLYGRFKNIYTDGDTSYGVSPVIDYNTKKIGLFTEVVTSVLPYKCDAKLKYLVDETGVFTELNQRNRNWQEVQNTFKTGEFLDVSQFNPQQYSNQIIVDGIKNIAESGYSYRPVMYMYGSSSNTPTLDMSFFNTNTDLGNLANNFFTNYPSGGLIIPNTNFSSSSLNGGSNFEVWDLFNVTSPNPNTISNFGTSFFTGSGPGVVDSNNSTVTSSYYKIPGSGSFTTQYSFTVNVQGQPGAEFTGSMELWLSSSLNGNFTRINQNSQSIKVTSQVYNALRFNWDENILNQNSYSITSLNSITLLNGYTFNDYNGTSANCGATPTTSTVLSADTNYTLYVVVDNITGQQVYNAAFYMDSNISTANISWQASSTPKYNSISQCSGANSNSTLTFSNNITIDTADPAYNPGDEIVFRFFTDTKSSGANIITSVRLNPFLEDLSFNVFTGLNTPQTPAILKVTPSNSSLLLPNPTVCIDQTLNAFYLSPQLSAFYGNNYFFDPLNVVTSASFGILYQEYGYVGYPFFLEPNDKIVVQIEGNDGYLFEYNIDSVAIIGNGSIYINIIEDISGYFNNLGCNQFFKIVFLKRLPDETNVIINLTKPEGKTSYGFILPSNISKTLLNNIDLVTKNSKQQLIDAGSNVIV